MQDQEDADDRLIDEELETDLDPESNDEQRAGKKRGPRLPKMSVGGTLASASGVLASVGGALAAVNGLISKFKATRAALEADEAGDFDSEEGGSSAAGGMRIGPLKIPALSRKGRIGTAAGLSALALGGTFTAYQFSGSKHEAGVEAGDVPAVAQSAEPDPPKSTPDTPEGLAAAPAGEYDPFDDESPLPPTPVSVQAAEIMAVEGPGDSDESLTVITPPSAVSAEVIPAEMTEDEAQIVPPLPVQTSNVDEPAEEPPVVAPVPVAIAQAAEPSGGPPVMAIPTPVADPIGPDGMAMNLGGEDVSPPVEPMSAPSMAMEEPPAQVDSSDGFDLAVPAAIVGGAALAATAADAASDRVALPNGNEPAEPPPALTSTPASPSASPIPDLSATPAPSGAAVAVGAGAVAAAAAMPDEPAVEMEALPNTPIQIVDEQPLSDAPTARAGLEGLESDDGTVNRTPTRRLQAVSHVVQRGENFWTISRLYYGSGRYYKALWNANRSVARAPDQLYIGSTIIVPPIEQLDARWFDATEAGGTQTSPRTTAVDDSTLLEEPMTASAPSDPEVQPAGNTAPLEPASDTVVMLPPEQPVRPSSETRLDRKPVPSTRTYVVRDHDTLRSIARDVLGDSRRAREILEVNAEALRGMSQLDPGIELRMPR